MPSWPKSNCGEKAPKVKAPKAPKPPKPVVVIQMPRRKKEIGMGTFGTEPMDTIAAPVTAPVESEAAPAPADTFTDSFPTPATDPAVDQPVNLNNEPSPPPPSSQATTAEATTALHDPIPPQSNPIRSDQSLRTPGTPATPGSAGLMTPYSTHTSYFPATPASGTTVATVSTTASTRTAAFGSHQDAVSTEPQPSSPSRGTHGPPVPETKRLRPARAEMPPAIVTTKTLASQHNAQTPLTPRTPAMFSTLANSYPTPSSLNTPTPKTPGSMSEWRMMQMQLQQQDDLHFSLTLPSVSALSLNIPYGRTAASPCGITPGSATGSIAPSVSASSSTCSCCCCSSAVAQTPNPTTPTFGHYPSGSDGHSLASGQHHLHPHSPSWNGIYQHHPNNSFHNAQQHLYNHCNSSSTSSDFFLQREANGQAPGSTATLNSEYASSSVDPCDYENPYGPNSAGSEGPLSQFSMHPQNRPSKNRHCKNCPLYHHRRPSAGAVLAGAPNVSGGVDMDISASSTSLTGSAHSNRASSPGPFRTLSSKLAANTIKKLSGTQKSLFNTSKEDLLAHSSGHETLQSNSSRENLGALMTETGTRAAVCCCCAQHGAHGGVRGGGGGGSIGSAEGTTKVQKMHSKLSNLRRKDKNKARKSREMDYNYSSQFVRQEFAQYNYERQIEDFQRAARVFKEQKALTTAAAAASIAAEARAAVAQAASCAAAEAAKNKKCFGEKSFSSSNTSLAITPIQEVDGENSPTEGQGKDKKDIGESENGPTGRHSHENSRPRKKSTNTTASPRSGLFRSISRPHRRVGSSTGSVTSGKGKKSHAGSGSRGSSIHGKGKTDCSYLELGQVGMGMGMDLKLPGLGLGTGFGFDPMNFGQFMSEGGSDLARHDARVVQDDSVYENIPLSDISFPTAPLSHSAKDLPKKPEDVHGFKGRSSNISQDGVHRSHANHVNNVRGRSVHSVCSVDTVSQQISARHLQHSRLQNLSSVASLHSQSQGVQSAGDPTGSGCGGTGGGSGNGAGGNGVVMENSPIQVVRATVGTVDDTSLPCFTFRMWVLSTVFVVMGAAISEYNFFRSNSAFFSIYFVQLASYFCGKGMARWLPTRQFELRLYGLAWVECKWKGADYTEDEVGVNSDSSTLSGNGRRVGSNLTGGPIRPTDRGGLERSNITSTKAGMESGASGGRAKRKYSWTFSLNPGKFNMKEHMLIGIAAAAGCSPAYATNVLAIQSLVFSSPLGTLTGMGLVVSSQCIGFSMAWFLFDYVIKPSVMIWPATLVNVSLYNTLHEHKVLTRWFTRMQLFWYAFFAIFIYQWLPRMFMPVLTSMALLCWIKPSSNVLRKLGSGYTGLGIGCVSLDWSIISGVGPLFTPWWAQCNFFVGLILMLWIITPIVYFSNYWSAMSYPIVSSNLYDNNAMLYDVSKIVNRDLSFNLTMYEQYSPVIMTPYFAITYGTSFMAVIATFIHVALYYGPDIFLIAKTQWIRKQNRMRRSPFYKKISVWVHGWPTTNNSNEIGEDSQDHVTSTASTTVGAPVIPIMTHPDAIGMLNDLSRRNSESVSFRIDLESSSGLNHAIGSGEERFSFHQSSHYRQLSQQQDSFQPVASVRRAASTFKSEEDDRQQVPTEMFGCEDIHTRLMRAYPEVPGLWFGVLFVLCFTMAVVVCHTSVIQLPVYALILAILLAAVFALPMAIIQALSSSQIGLNVLSEVVCGYLLPGNQLGNSVFKCYSYMALYQCLNLTQGFKLGHYMKVPPRKIFIMVLYGTLVGAFVNLQVLNWVLTYNRKELFDADLRSGWSFRNLDLFFSASLLWGAISPKRLFGDGSIYHFLPYCFIIGILLPIPFYLMYRAYPPYGSLCRGTTASSIFTSKCKCPISQTPLTGHASRHEGAPSRIYGDLSPAGYPSFRLDRFRTSNLESGGRSCCFPFYSKQERDKEEKALTDKTSSATTSAPPDGSSTFPSTSTTPPSPHLYYGRPDCKWENRLRRVPWHLVNMPLVCAGASFVPQAPASFVVSAGLVAFCFAFLVLRFRHEWWRRYTFVLAAALDSGTQICNMAIFVVFSLILKGSAEFPTWFGNDGTNPEKCGVGDGYH